MPYIKLYYHFVWATDKREPFITPDIESPLYRYLSQKTCDQKAHLFAINGMPDHIHMIVALPPSARVAEFVQILKGSSSHFVTAEFKTVFAWQKGYSAFTVNEPGLKKAIQYVLNQKTHHATGKTIRLYEPDETRDDE